MTTFIPFLRSRMRPTPCRHAVKQEIVEANRLGALCRQYRGEAASATCAIVRRCADIEAAIKRRKPTAVITYNPNPILTATVKTFDILDDSAARAD